MIETIDQDGIPEVIHKGPLTAVQIADLNKTLVEKFKNSGGLKLKFCDTDECDALGIQLLCIFSQTAAAQKKTFLLKGDLDSVFDMAVRTGLTPEDYFLFDKKES